MENLNLKEINNDELMKVLKSIEGDNAVIKIEGVVSSMIDSEEFNFLITNSEILLTDICNYNVITIKINNIKSIHKNKIVDEDKHQIIIEMENDMSVLIYN